MLSLCILLTALVASTRLADEAVGADVRRCETFAAGAAARRAEPPTGTGPRIVVVGDSWSAGLGLRDPSQAWTSRLEGRVHVDAFSGSGFSAAASPCRGASFAARVERAVEGGADLVVLEGGLNDVDQSVADLRAGFERVLAPLDGLDVVVVGPAAAPARAAGAAWVDTELAVLTGDHGVAYVSTRDLDLPYLSDGLHLTTDGHRAFGEAVATRIAGLAG